MPRSRILITDHHENESFPLRKCRPYSTICVQLAGDHYGLGLTQINPLLTKRGDEFYIFASSDLDL